MDKYQCEEDDVHVCTCSTDIETAKKIILTKFALFDMVLMGQHVRDDCICSSISRASFRGWSGGAFFPLVTGLPPPDSRQPMTRGTRAAYDKGIFALLAISLLPNSMTHRCCPP